MRAVRLWLTIFLSGYALAMAMFFSTVLTPVPYGDLTRIGRVSETAFGWRATRPAIDLALLASTPIEDADVLVIGDSFSIGRVWQSVLKRDGVRVATSHWDDIGPLCDDLPDWLKQSGFRGGTLIIESIERSVATHMADARRCRNMKAPFKPATEARQAPSTHPPSFVFNTGAPLTTGWATWRNTWAATTVASGVLLRSPEWGNRPLVAVHGVADGCRQFSHRACEEALFLQDDVTLPAPTPSDVEDMSRISAALGSLRTIWMIVPDKTTVYVDPARSSSFMRAFVDAGLGPDLFALAQSAKTRIMDLYMPNDTHWSTSGYLAFGASMRDWLNRSNPVERTQIGRD